MVGLPEGMEGNSVRCCFNGRQVSLTMYDICMKNIWGNSSIPRLHLAPVKDEREHAGRVNYNIMLGLVERRAGIGQNTGYVAVNSLVVAVAGALSGLFGGAVAKWLAGWQGAFLGYTFTYHGVLFLLAGGFRLMALLWLRKIEDPRAFAARDAMRYMVADVYANLQNTLAMPVRVAGRMTYKLSPSRWFGNKR